MILTFWLTFQVHENELECGVLGCQYPLTPSNMGLGYLNAALPNHIEMAYLYFIPGRQISFAVFATLIHKTLEQRGTRTSNRNRPRGTKKIIEIFPIA